MTNKMVFDSSMRKYGGRLNEWPAPFREFLSMGLYPGTARLKRIAEIPGESDAKKLYGRIYLDYINSWSINAVAMEGNDSFLIGINAGVPIKLALLFNALMSHPDIFPKLGNAAGLKPFDIIHLNLSEEEESSFGRVQVSKEGTPFFPNVLEAHDLRAVAHARLFCFASTFLWLHEVAHIVVGHLEYIKSKLGLAVHPKLGATPSDQLPVRIFQAIEVDADRWAAIETVRYFSLGESGEDEIGLWLLCFAVGVLFNVFNLASRTLIDYKQATHPHPQIRCLWAITEIVKDYARIRSKRFIDIAPRVISGVSEYIRRSAVLFGAEEASQDLLQTEKGQAQIEILKQVEQLTVLEPQFADCLTRLLGRI